MGNLQNVKSDDEISYSKLLLWQIERINRYFSENNPAAIHAVEVFDILLYPHHDPDYGKEKKTIDEFYEKAFINIKKYSYAKGGRRLVIQKTNMDMARSKYRILMGLLGRRDLLPEQKGDFFAKEG